jgi:hypothetical protein
MIVSNRLIPTACSTYRTKHNPPELALKGSQKWKKYNYSVKFEWRLMVTPTTNAGFATGSPSALAFFDMQATN